MSHCLIVELSHEPIETLFRVGATTIEEDDGFMATVADYVADIECPYEEAVQTFLDELGEAVTFDPADNSITFVNKEAFFQESYELFKKIVNNLTLENFMDHRWAWNATECIKSSFGTYIYYYYPKQIDEFVRDEVHNGDKFYIGGICDYHC